MGVVGQVCLCEAVGGRLSVWAWVCVTDTVRGVGITSLGAVPRVMQAQLVLTE